MRLLAGRINFYEHLPNGGRVFLYSALLYFLGELNFAFGFFKVFDFLANEVENFAVCGTAVIFRYIVKLVVEFGINFDAKVFVVLVSHKNLQNNLNISIF